LGRTGVSRGVSGHRAGGLLGVDWTVEGWKRSYGTGYIGSANGILLPTDLRLFHPKVGRTGFDPLAWTDLPMIPGGSVGEAGREGQSEIVTLAQASALP